MGGKVSTETNISENAQLGQLAGIQSISDNDPFWNRLFSFNLNLDQNDAKLMRSFDESLGDVLQNLMYNTPNTNNFASLVRVFLRRTTELKISEQCENKIFLWQTANSLIILRYICKFLTERMSEAEMIRVFDKQETNEVEESSDEDDHEEVTQEELNKDKSYDSKAEELLDSLIDILVQLPVNDLTLAIHVETVKCLITLLSSQLYNQNIDNKSIIFGYFLNGLCSKQSSELTKSLLHNYLVHNTEYKTTKKQESESIIIGLASSMWSMVQVVTGLDEASESPSSPSISLGSLSLLLLLDLACHLPTSGLNPFKETLSLFQNSQEVSTLPTQISSFKLDYSMIYERLCATAGQEPPMLLLYLLLHRNSGFRNFVLSRINLENLVVPVLRILHEGVSSSSVNPHHLYLALIVMLILSEDDFFCKIIHETMVRDIEWVENDRPMKEISLGGLTAMIFIRIIQKNAIKMRDRYLHTNCLAALANMSSCFKYLAPVVCQKLISLLELLTKRHAKMVEHMRMSTELDVSDGQPINFHEDITALEEGIRTLLEIINSTLISSLRHNGHLIYTLLYHRSLFDSYQHHPMFQDLLSNISLVISHFSSKVVNVKAGDGAAMMEIIEKEAVVWPTDRLAKFPELKFRYVEDECTVDFFVPYVWRLSYQHSAIHFNPSRVKIFNAMSITE